MRAELKDRLEEALMRRMLNLPSIVARRIFGEPPVNDRGTPLELQTHVLMRLIAMSNPPEVSEMTVSEAREFYRETMSAMDFEPAAIPSIVDRSAPGPAGEIPVRIYRARPGRLPAIVFYHGGGFVLGDLDTYDGICSRLAKWTNCVVISVDYRLAPEHPFPAAVEDGVAAFRWVVQNEELLEIIPERVAVAGDSAGANLSAVVSHITAQDEVQPALQVLVYPTTDYDPGYPSMELFAEGFFLTARNMVWFTDHYMQGQEVADARIAPILQEDLSGQPPCLIMTAGFDPLRDEGEAYAAKLREAGVRVIQREATGLVHGFISMGGIIAEAAKSNEELARVIERELWRELD